MTELVAKAARWIWNKLVVLILIVLVLLAAGWFRSEWKSIAVQLKQVSEIDQRIDNARSGLATLRSDSIKLGEEAQNETQELRAKEKIAQHLWEEAEKAKARYEDASSRVGWYQKWFDTGKVIEKGRAWSEYQTRKAAAVAAQEVSDALETALQHSPWMRQRREIEAHESEIERLENERGEILSESGRTPGRKLVMAIREVLPLAIWTMVGIILAPVVIKWVLYYLVAPRISRARPVILLPEAGGDVQAGTSAVSVSVQLDAGDEIIVHSDYLQAAGVGPGKQTRWLLSWRMPFTSLAAGLYMMVSVRNRGSTETKVTVSPKKDLFDMICDVSLPEGGAMVIYPRSLVGIVMKNGISPRITRHWRLDSLHSWITFQFRYIVIHGAGRILLKGCRGVRAERVETTKPGMQDQLATLGFTANLAYSGIRCETFTDYLLGRDELFNDCFSEADGFYFTEEVPNIHRKSGLFGRGLEGVIDGFLKAFGI
jgi:hypothetical protein